MPLNCCPACIAQTSSKGHRNDSDLIRRIMLHWPVLMSRRFASLISCSSTLKALTGRPLSRDSAECLFAAKKLV